MAIHNPSSFTNKIEVINHAASFLYRALGYQTLESSMEASSMITKFNNNKRLIVLLIPSGDYTIIYMNGEEAYTLQAGYENLFPNLKLPITPKAVDEYFINKKTFAVNLFIGFAFTGIGDIPKDIKAGRTKKQLDFINNRLLPAQRAYKQRDEEPKFTKEELDMLIYEIIKPTLAGEVLFPMDEREKTREEEKAKEKKEQKAKKRAAQKEKKRKEMEEKERREQEERSKVDVEEKYPIYNPPPLSGFEPN